MLSSAMGTTGHPHPVKTKNRAGTYNTLKQSPRLQIYSALGYSEPDLDQHISLPGTSRCMKSRSVEVYTNLPHLQHPLERNSTGLL